jgi:hypothetical protein
MLFTADAGFVVAGATGAAAYALVALVTRAYTLAGIETALRWLLGREGAIAAVPHLPVTPLLDPNFVPLILEPGRMKGVRAASKVRTANRSVALRRSPVGDWVEGRDLRLSPRGPHEG